MFDPLQVAPKYLRALADRLESMMSGVLGDADGPPKETPGKWNKDFDMEAFHTGGAGGAPPPWAEHCAKYRGSTFLDPVPQIFKRRYVYDREVGDRAVHIAAEEYSDITIATTTDFALDSLDDRLTRKEFDIPIFQTELPPEGQKGKPYTFFMVDISGSMNGIRSSIACALAQVAAEKVFAEDGVFVFLPYGGAREDAVEFTDLPSLITHLKGVNFDKGTTYIGEHLKCLSFALSMRSAYTHNKGSYTVPADCDKSRSKIFVVHDGEDKVEDVALRVPVFAITLANKHENLEKLAKKTGGKYMFIKNPN